MARMAIAAMGTTTPMATVAPLLRPLSLLPLEESMVPPPPVDGVPELEVDGGSESLVDVITTICVPL